MKNVVLAFFCCIGMFSTAQLLEGEIVEEGRGLKTKIDFVQEGNTNGWAKYELAVDRTGKVTSVRLIETTIKSTVSKMKLKNYLMKSEFEAGTHYPKFHHVVIKMTLVSSL